MTAFTESVVEDAALAWLEAAGWQIAHGPDISPAGGTLALALSQGQRANYGELVLAQRFRDALLPKLISGALRVKEAETFVQKHSL